MESMQMQVGAVVPPVSSAPTSLFADSSRPPPQMPASVSAPQPTLDSVGHDAPPVDRIHREGAGDASVIAGTAPPADRHKPGSLGSAAPASSSSRAALPAESPEASSLSAQAANRLRPPVNHPPYAPPRGLDILYPLGSKPNPFAGSMEVQPTFGAEHPPGSLYRPDVLPPDLDDRLEKGSIWIKLEKRTNKATFLSPPPCEVCRAPNIAQHCDRGYPVCGRCHQKGSSCEYRDAQWTNVRPKAKKKRKVPAIDGIPVNGHGRPDKGKQRASYDDDDGTESTASLPARVRAKASAGYIGAKEQRPLQPLYPGFRTLDGRGVLEANMRGQPPLRGHCWAAMVETEPVLAGLRMLSTDGGRVGVSKDDTAAGVVLTGKHHGQGAFFGKGKYAGTLVVSMGCQRARHEDQHQATQEEREASPSFAEEVAVESLLLAERFRTPIALVIAQDYEGFDFCTQAPYELFGWFWVAQAWLEPDVPSLKLYAHPQAQQNSFPAQLRWKFRFEYCPSQGEPWWADRNDPPRAPLPKGEDGEANAWHVRGPRVSGSSTVTARSAAYKAFDKKYAYSCSSCSAVSERVYRLGNFCLNEQCPLFFGDRTSDDYDWYIGPPTNAPGRLPPIMRLEPQESGLPLLPSAQPVPAGPRSREDIGTELWEGIQCGVCGTANEATRVASGECVSCSTPLQRQYAAGSRPLISVGQLRRPDRPLSRMARTDDGFPFFPLDIARTSTTYEDQVRVVNYRAGRTDEDAQMMLAMNVERDAVDAARWDKLLNGLLDPWPAGPQLVRYLEATSKNDKEQRRSPYFAFAVGDEAGVESFGIPVGAPVAWRDLPASCESVNVVMARINELFVRMWPGREELNSLVILAVPPSLPAISTVHFTIEPQTYAAVFWLGSDGALRIRQTGKSDWGNKQAELRETQSGDLFGIYSGTGRFELSPLLENFGFICLAQRVDEAALHSKAEARTSEPTRKPRASNKPAKAPTANWYIGPRPLDPTRPLRAAPSMRAKPLPIVEPSAESDANVATAAAAEVLDEVPDWTGIDVLSQAPSSPRELAPPPYTMPELPQAAQPKPKKAAAASIAAPGNGKASAASTPKSAKSKKRKSAAAAATPEAVSVADDRSSIAIKLEEEPGAAPSKGKKRARKSDAAGSTA